jgi:hypothetical protein
MAIAQKGGGKSAWVTARKAVDEQEIKRILTKIMGDILGLCFMFITTFSIYCTKLSAQRICLPARCSYKKTYQMIHHLSLSKNKKTCEIVQQ